MSVALSAPGPPQDLEPEFTAAWEAFALATRRARARLAREEGLPLTPAQLHLLEALDGSDGLTVGRIAEAAGVSPPTATRMLDGLVRDGVVERRAEPGDRRCVRVEITAAGAELVTATRASIAERRAALFARLEPRERETAARLLRRLADLVDDL